MKFAERLTQKLRSMKISVIAYPSRSRIKQLFNGLVGCFDRLKELKSHMVVAQSIPIDYMRVAAVREAEQHYREGEERAVECVVELLGECWNVADAVAKALIAEVTTTEKAKKAAQRAANAVNSLLCRYFLHLASFPKEAGVKKFAQTIEAGIQDNFPDTAAVEEIGWLQGSIVAADGAQGSCDGVYVVLRAKDDSVLLKVKQFLQELGSGQVSTPEMIVIPRPEEEELSVANDSGEVRSSASEAAKVS